MTENIDIAVKRQTNGFFDIDIDDSTGDFVLTPGFNTNLKIALFEERRAQIRNYFLKNPEVTQKPFQRCHPFS